MSKNRRFNGLSFKYSVNGKVLLDKYKSLEEFLNTNFPKNNNELSPTFDTIIRNIKWNGHTISNSTSINTLNDLIKFLSTDNIFVSKNDIRLSQFKPKQELIRKETYSIDEVRQKVKDVLFYKDKRYAKIDFNGDLIKGNSQRYQTFFTKGCKCVKCGIEGKYFAKERFRDQSTYHLNLYAIDDNGNEVLMTKDHIIPHSKGGSDDISNYQTMCKICNEAKGSKIED